VKCSLGDEQQSSGKAGRLADQSGRRDKMLKSGTVPPETGRMVSLGRGVAVCLKGEVLMRQCENVTSSNKVHLPGSLYNCMVRLVLYTYSVICVFICGSSLFIRRSPFMNGISPFSG